MMNCAANETTNMHTHNVTSCVDVYENRSACDDDDDDDERMNFNVA